MRLARSTQTCTTGSPRRGMELVDRNFQASVVGDLDAIELLNAQGVEQLGIEGSASRGLAPTSRPLRL